MFRPLFLLAAVVLTVCQGCSKPKPAPKPFDCPSFQQRAAECEQATVDLLRKKVAADASTPDADQQFRMLESRLRKKIAEGRPQKQCEKILAGGDAERVKRIQACHAAQGCEAFAECLVEL